jgi:riboflavin synthase
LFTGIVEALGEVIKITSSGVQIESSVSFDDTKIGDSVAVNGICE